MKNRFIILKLVFAILLHHQLYATTYIVGKQKHFSSIKQALQQCKNGDTILVEKGLYKEQNIIINKSIVLKGLQQPVLDGELKYEIISVKADNVIVDGFHLQHSGRSGVDDIAGLKIYNARNVTISNNSFEDTFWGIYSLYNTHCFIINNALKASGRSESENGNGIHCWKSDSMQIIGNRITGHRDGIYFEFVTNSIILKNVSVGNVRYGLHFMFSHNDEYAQNVFENNGAGVAVMFSHGVNMHNNTFKKNWGDAAYGLLLKEIADSKIVHNKIVENTIGIYMEGTSRIKVEKNIFNSNGWALRVQASCNDNVITQNNFLSNTFDIATNGSLVLNSFDHNYWDKYEGYDLDKNKTGDVPYRPVSLYSMIVEKNPTSMILFRSFMVTLFDKTEKVLPGIIPENLKDNFPLMKPLNL